MTLALYGKSRRRQGVLVLLALFAVFAALIGGVSLQPTEGALAADTGFLSPSTTPGPNLEFSDPSNAFAQDDLFAFEESDGDQQTYGSFSFPDLSGATIQGISVEVDAWARNPGDTSCQVLARVWRESNGAGAFSSPISITLPTDSDSDVYRLAGGATNLWGQSGWVASDFTNANFAVDLQYSDPPGPNCASGSGDGIALDHLRVKVHYAVSTTRTVAVQKVASSTLHAGGSFTVNVNPQGGSPVPQMLTLAPAATSSAASTAVNVPGGAGSTVVEAAPPAGWSLVGYQFIDLTANPSGTCSTNAADYAASTGVPDDTANYLVCVLNSPLVVTPGAFQVFEDAQDANDEPGQKDLTRMSTNTIDTDTLEVTWNWDMLGLAGNNTLDACALFDTDDIDQNANFSLCVTATGDPATLLSTTLYSCNNLNADRCNGNSPISGIATTCHVAVSTDDPFEAGFLHPRDAKATCTIDLSDVGGAAIATLIDVCSYPSEQPNSDPSDCILAQTGGVSRTIRVMKVTDPGTHPGGAFSGTISPGGDVSFAVSLAANTAVSAAESNIVSDLAQTVIENTPPTDWTNAGYFVVLDAAGSYQCTGSETYGVGPALVPSGNGNYTVCVKNTYDAPTRTLRIMKVTGSALHPAQTFAGTISPGPATSFSVSLPQNVSASTAQSLTVSTAVQTVTETPVPAGWTQAGYAVLLDATGLYLCTGSETYGNVGGSATVPVGGNYVVCVKNTYNLPEVSIAKSNNDADAQIPAGTSFNWTITVNVAVNPTTAPITVSDTVPAGFTITNVVAPDFPGCTFAGPSLAGCILPANAAVGPHTITVTVTAPADFPMANCAAYTNSATLSGTTGMTVVVAPGETAAAGTATDQVTVINCRNPQLALSKSSSVESVVGGGTFTWTIRATVSDGPTGAAATIVDTLPAGFTFNGAPTFAGSQDATKLSCLAPVGQTVTCTLAAQAANGDYVINIPVTAPAALTLAICTAHQNQATASFPASQGTVTGSPATDSVTVTCPDVSILKTRTSPATVTPGPNTITYDIVVSNAGPGTAYNIQVNDSLQAGVVWSATSAGAGCVAGNSPMCVIASIPAGQSVTITVTGTTTSPASCGIINNTASILGANDTTTGNNSSSAQPVTVECPDASVVKTLTSPASIDSGDTIIFTITVLAGPNGPSQNIVLTDVLEETMSWTLSGSDLTGCNGPTFPSGGTLTCTIPVLAANASRTYTLTAVTTAAVCGLVDNSASITSTVDVNSSNNSSTAADVTVNCPNVVLAKTTSTPGPLNAGDPISYTITATNNGTGAAKDFFLVDSLPTSVTGWQISPANPACAITGTELRCPGTSPATTTLAAGASLSVTVTGTTTPNSCGTVVNTAHAEASNDGTQGITDAAAPAINVLCPDITVLKDGNGPVNAGDQVIFTITVDNIGQGTATNVTLNDTLTTGQFWTLDPAVAGCTLTPTGAPQSLSCSWPTFTGAEPAKVITLRHPTGTGSGLTCTPIVNTAGVTAANESTTAAANQNSSTDSVSINCADIRVLKVADASPVSGTDNIGFVIKVWNTGVGEARDVQLTDTLPANPGLSWSEDSAACTIAGGVLTCNFGTLPANQTEADATTVHLTSPTTVATCGTVSNAVAQVTTSNDGSATDGENIVVNCPDVTVSKALYNTPNPVSAGDTIKFRIVVTVNGAPGTVAKNVTVNEQLPQTTSSWSVESTTPSGICATLASNLMCTLGDVTIPAGGGPVTFEIIISGTAIGPNGEVTCSGNITNTVTVGAGNESNTTNNEATAAVGVNCPIIVVDKSASSPSVTAGDPVTFTITVRNTGGGTAYNVVVEDDLPPSLTWSETDAACGIVGDKLTCNIAQLAPGAEKSVDVTATTDPAECTFLRNQAFASAGNDNLPGSGQVSSVVVDVDLLCSDVSITKAPEQGGEVLDLGDTITFIITVNVAAGADAHDVVVSDELPDAPGLVWTASAPCTVTPAADAGPQVLTCEFDEIADGGSETIEVTSNAMTMDTCGPITNIASVVAGNENPDNVDEGNTSNEATVFVNCPDLEVLKTGADIVNGEAPVFTITVKNIGVGVAKAVSVIDQLPSGWTTALVASVPAACTLSAQGPQCTTLAPNETLTVTVTGEVTTTQCDPIVNSVSVTASNESEDTVIQANNSATATINITCGTIQVVKIDNVLVGNPNLSNAWHFTVSRDQAQFDTAEIALGGGAVQVLQVPFGTYTVTEVEDQGIDTCPIPNPVTRTFRTLVDDETQDINADNLIVTFTFTNEECGIVASTGFLEIHKVSDINGNHVMDGGDTKLGGWPMTITGPEFPGGVVINTDSQGRVLLLGIETGSYTVVEGSRAGYTTVGVVVDDNGTVFSAANTATVDLAFSDTDIITFYNQPRGTIVVQKNAVIRHNGIESDSPADRDGWVMTVRSAACGVDQQAATNASGIATFSNLPMCSDYVVSETPVNPGSPNFTVVGSPSQSPFTPGLMVATEVTFTNERVTTDPPCPNCSQQPTPTPTATATQAPPTPSATPTNTPVPTNTVGPSTATPTAVSTSAGERTPGPGQPTPVAPSTGEGIFGGDAGGTNLLLVLAGLAALAGGVAIVAFGRRSGGR